MNTQPHHHSLRGAIRAHGRRRRPAWHRLTTALTGLCQSRTLLLLARLCLAAPATHAAELATSDGAAGDRFGVSVSQSGDQFTIGAYGANSFTGKAYTGTVSSVITLDAGSTSRTIDGVSFVSQTDWIIGQNTSSNAVTLLTGNTAKVTASGKAVYVGQNAGSNNNTLTINGALTANQVNVGTIGNTGNTLVVNGTATAPITVASGSTLSGHGTVGAISGAGTVTPVIRRF